jgi:magnesium chelatase subunit D
MNPEEGELRPQLLDRFGLCVDVEGIDDPDLRVEIAERDAAFRTGDPAFAHRFREADVELGEALVRAIAGFPEVELTPRHARLVSTICVEAGVQGHRGDVVTGQTARALAAFRGRSSPTRGDVYDAAELALAHRARAQIRREQQEQSPADEAQRREGDDEQQPQQGESSQPGPSDADQQADAEQVDANQADSGQQATGADEGVASGSAGGSEAVPDASDQFAVKKIELPRKRAPRKQSGKRASTRSPDRRGRYVRAQTQEKVTDLAVDATVRAAAPYQVKRGRETGERMMLERQDLHQKVRERKVGNLIVFVVDASASMDAEQRMAATKGAILSLLQDAYVRRDRVAVIVFKNRSAEVVLRPTSSVSLAQRRLERLSVGGTTPLTHGLMAGYKVIRSELTRDPSIRPLLVLISDGRGNISMFKEEPLVEAQKVAALISSEKIESLVIDSARDFSHLPSVQHLARVAPMYQTYAINACADLADRMGARYYGLYDLSRDEIASAVATQLRKRG